MTESFMRPDAGRGGHPHSYGHSHETCEEFARAAGMSRRRVLKGLMGAGALGVAHTAFGGVFRQAVFGAETDNNVVVVLSLRGGIDGMSVVVPYGDPAYLDLRDSIAVPEGALLHKNGLFGLHPHLAPLEQQWADGRMAAVHATGLSVPNRSHFSAMEEVEDADPGSDVRRGWINRAIGLDSDAFPTEAVQFGTSIVPTSLTGPSPVIAAQSMKELVLAGANPQWDDATWQGRRRTQLETIWSKAGGVLGVSARDALSTVDELAPYARATYTPHNGAVYPTDWRARDLADALANTAQLIRANVGTEVVAIDFGSWDMHSDVGNLGGGDMQAMLTALATSLAAFLTDVSDLGNRVTVVTISEFGRRAQVNGNAGLDHGWGNMMLLFGGGVLGGQYYGTWPWLDPDKLVDGDLKVTTDYRNVLGEVVEKRLNRAPTAVFPNLAYDRLDILTTL
jgi:uncharacterized protein (DUF1501 family)